MAEASDERGILLQNLEDAGCSKEMIQKCMIYAGEHEDEKLMQALVSHRQGLLEMLHGCHEKIDCLDYLVYRLEKERKVQKE